MRRQSKNLLQKPILTTKTETNGCRMGSGTGVPEQVENWLREARTYQLRIASKHHSMFGTRLMN